MSAIEKSLPILNKIEEIETLPPFPLLSNIIKSFLVADNEGDLRPLISNIETEPNIVAKVIGAANSAYFGSNFSVYSLKDAVARLGINQLKTIVFGVIVSQRFNTKLCPEFNVSRFWVDSMLHAYCATHYAEHSEKKRFDKNLIYCLGLLQHIGILALIHLSPQEMNTLFKSKEGSLLYREQEVFQGVDHYDAGSALLQHWQLPKEFYMTVGYINEKSSDKDLVMLLKRSKELLDTDFTAENPKTDAVFGITKENMESIQMACDIDKNWIESFASHL